MGTSDDTLIPITVTPGVQPPTDKSSFASVHYTASQGIRFRFGFPQKIGGWMAIPIAYSNTIVGWARSMMGSFINGAILTVIGTNQKVYSLFGSILTNITPQTVSTTSVSNSLTSDYGTLASNPIKTTSGSPIITITDANAADYIVGDIVTLSGATTVGGITPAHINTELLLHSVGATSYTAVTSQNATSTATGGGASVVRATGRITVGLASNTVTNGERIGILNAQTMAGITMAQLNEQFIARNSGASSFDVMTSGTATSHVTAAGGTSAAITVEIPTGAINQSFGQGYGCGLYGEGLYGTALQSTSALSYPRIWFFDRFGTDIIMCAGNQTGIYSWAGSNTVAPALVANAPTAVNYAFVSNNILIALGANGVPNNISTSDQGNMTNWTSSSSNQVFNYTETRAGQWKSHVSLNGMNLLFTDYQTYSFSYLGYTAGNANAIWSLNQLEGNVGLIAPMARVAVDGVAYWMGQNNFYMYSGGYVSIVPANSQEMSTILNYVFTNLNRSQGSKCFALYNELFDEIEFHYPSGSSNECDSVARLNRTDLTWCPDSIERTCAEYPNNVFGYPRMIDWNSVLYEHEQGNDANGSPLSWMIATNEQGRDYIKNSLRMLNTENAMLTGFVPDSLQTGNINVEIIGKRFPQSANPMFDNNYTVTPTTEQMPTQGGARIWQYIISGSALGQQWIMGQWSQFVKQSSKQ